MEFASPLSLLVKCLWGLARKPLGSIYSRKDNVDLLRKETEDLKAKSEDVKARVEREERGGGVQRTKQVEKWLDEVQEFVGGVDQLLGEVRERDQIKCLGRCLSRNCRSSYRLGKRVEQMLNEARELQTKEGKFGILTSPLPPPPVLEMPMDETVGLDIFLNKVWKWLLDEKQVRVIGLYGTGGVGKTTLMKRINEKLARANHGFEIVIWVVVSRQVNEDSIRDALRKRLHFQDESWNRWSPDERVHHLCHVLTQKKFVLFVDDVWQRLDLSNIGVPLPSVKNGSKVVFTTRLKHVCDQMGANKTLEVECLMPEEALKLFEKNVGKSLVDCHQEIRDLANDIAEECKGLPLALITVGQAMARKENSREWRHALTTLRNNPHKLSGMVEEVYHILEFSYNSLNDTTLQLCFLYCCLFPEHYPIRPDELIELWIGEGLLGDTDDVYSLRDKGEYVLGSLNTACLLENGHGFSEGQYVKMHDVIRDMATWIARDRGQKENKLLVIENEEDMSVEMISKRGEAEKVSLWGKRIRNIDRTLPRCSQLETLFVRETNVWLVPRGFFNSMMACLTFLNLSGNRNMQSFPEGICNLINLRYLNMSATGISKLPREIKNLTHLRWLLLDEIFKDNLVPTGAITSLPLNVFSKWTGTGSGQVKEDEMVEELGHMHHLADLSLAVCKSSSALNIFQSHNIQRCIRRARIIDSKDLTRIQISHSPTGSGTFSHLEELYLQRCYGLREMEITQGPGRAPNRSCFPSLFEVEISRCGLSNLSWLVHAPKLRKLTVQGCSSMENIIGHGFASEELAASGLFSRLELLSLSDLPNLTSICDQALSFPKGVSFRIAKCHGLRKLPLDSNSARETSFSVSGEAHWWAKFEWDDPCTKVTLLEKEKAFGDAIREMKEKAMWVATMQFRP
ncbi:disease resistance protein RPS5-like [Rhodamnia argentea]|uniref:Disease resistance protein RPS5-like n=1 Tax=Rhodamnia argentea TaxID=178133 RepID=A0A8B8QAD6_9MYRT|nr:disease resistance protein RPS5-like [Rhodamnia argentea]